MNHLKPKILIGIAAYNSQANIQNLVYSLLNQKSSDFDFQVYVHSDASVDDTVKIVQKIELENVIIEDNKNRRGFAGSAKHILNKGKEYYATLILNDDIVIKDNEFLLKLLRPALQQNNNLGLITGNPIPVEATNFIQKVGNTSFNIYRNVSYSINDGNNKWTADGKVLLFTQQFIKSIEYPESDKEMGNFDAFMYFSCLENGFEYLHIKDAVVFYRMPTSIKEYLKWDSRNKSNKYLLSKRFGKSIDNEYSLPKQKFVLSVLKEFFRNPIGVIFLVLIRLFAIWKAKRMAQNFDSKWEVIGTTKNLKNIQ